MKRLKIVFLSVFTLSLIAAIVSFGFTILVGLFVVAVVVIGSLACMSVCITIVEILIDYFKTIFKHLKKRLT